MRSVIIILLLTCLSAAVAAPTTPYVFQTPEQQALFENLLPDLRCLVCQNESLADSNAALAEDLRHEVYLQVLAGKNRQEIITYLTARYGEFILFKPRVESKTYVLWYLPFVLLVCGFVLIFFISRRHRSQKLILTAEQRAAAEKLLRDT